MGPPFLGLGILLSKKNTPVDFESSIYRNGRLRRKKTGTSPGAPFVPR
jgi:hypothetical protein